MRLLILLAFFYSQVLMADETSKYVLSQKAFDFIKITQWIDYIKRVKSDEPIPPFYIFKVPTSHFKKILDSYDLPTFEQGLNKKLANLITETELQNAMKTISNPYFTKFYNDLHLFSASYDDINALNSESKSELNRYKLIESIYNLMSLKVVMQNEYNKYKVKIDEQKRIIELLENPDIESNREQLTEISEEEFKNAFLVKLNSILSNYKDGELREIIRITKNEKDLLKFVSIIGTYSYFYMDKTKELVMSKDKKKSSLGLK